MSDAVNHPQHYSGNGIEVIDAIEAWGLNFSRGNAIKYIARAGKKNDEIEDLEKAEWYIEREIERIKKRKNAYKKAVEEIKKINKERLNEAKGNVIFGDDATEFITHIEPKEIMLTNEQTTSD